MANLLEKGRNDQLEQELLFITKEIKIKSLKDCNKPIRFPLALRIDFPLPICLLQNDIPSPRHTHMIY